MVQTVNDQSQVAAPTWLRRPKARIGSHLPILAAVSVLPIKMGLELIHLQSSPSPVLSKQADNLPVAEAHGALLVLARGPYGQTMVKALIPNLGTLDVFWA